MIPIYGKRIENRKIMSQIAWRQISFGMGKALSGCPEPVTVKETADNLT